MTTTRTTQEPGQFAGDAPLTGHHIQGHSINVILAKGVPEEVLRSSVTHFGTRGLFGKPIRRTSQHDRDNVRRKRWRVAQSLKPKVKPKLSSQFDDDEGQDHQGRSGCNRRVSPSVHNATGSMKTAEKSIPAPLPSNIRSLPPNNVNFSSSPHTHFELPPGVAFMSDPPPQTMNRPNLGMRDPSAMGTAIRASIHQERHSGRPPAPVTAASGALRGRQWHGPAIQGPESTTGAQRACGPVRATGATLHQRAMCPYPSHSHQFALSNAHLTHPPTTAESSAVARRVCYGMPPIAAIGVHQAQVRQQSGAPMMYALHDNAHVLFATTSPSHAHAYHAHHPPVTHMTPTALVNSGSQNEFSTPTMSTTMNVQQRSRATHTSGSAYSELAHALVDPHSIASPAAPFTSASIGAVVVHPPLYAAQAKRSGTASRMASVHGSLAWNAYEQNGLHAAPHQVLNYPSTEPVVNVAVAPSTSRARANSNRQCTASTFEGRFEYCGPFRQNIIAPPAFGVDVSQGQGTDETYLEAPTFASGNNLHHQLQIASTWQKAHLTCMTHITVPQAYLPA